jgi:hypothetical protein
MREHLTKRKYYKGMQGINIYQQMWLLRLNKQIPKSTQTFKTNSGKNS